MERNHSVNLSENIIEDDNLEDFEEFDLRDAINVGAYSVMSAIGIILNSVALVISRRKCSLPAAKSRTNVHYLVFHLTLADSVICFITLPMETLWRLTIEWHAGNIMCKVLMMFRTGGYILSSLILVVISIDRYLSISKPLSTINTGKLRNRARMMVLVSWLLTIIFSSPQDLSEERNRTLQNGTSVTELAMLGMTPDTWHSVYHTLVNCEIFFLPLVIIIISYVRIYSIISLRNVNRNLGVVQSDGVVVKSRQEGGESHQLKENLLDTGLRYSIMRTSVSEARVTTETGGSRMKALKMSIVHVSTFVLFWTPYTVMATWENVDYESSQMVPGLVQDIIYLTAVLNSCVNPIIYGMYFYTGTKRRHNASRVRLTSVNHHRHSSTSMATANTQVSLSPHSPAPLTRSSTARPATSRGESLMLHNLHLHHQSCSGLMKNGI